MLTLGSYVLIRLGFLLAILVVYLIFKKTSKTKILFYCSIYIYLSGLICITFLPLPTDKELIKVLQQTQGNSSLINIIPFKSLIDLLFNLSILEAFKQILGNILLFIPLGFFLPLVFNKLNDLKKVFIAILFSALSIEIVQLLMSLYFQFPYRYCDIDDFILNSIGGLLGFLILYYTRPTLNTVVKIPSLKI